MKLHKNSQIQYATDRACDFDCYYFFFSHLYILYNIDELVATL